MRVLLQKTEDGIFVCGTCLIFQSPILRSRRKNGFCNRTYWVCENPAHASTACRCDRLHAGCGLACAHTPRTDTAVGVCCSRRCLWLTAACGTGVCQRHLDKGRPSKEQLPMWERRPSGNLGKFLAVARPRSGINTLIRVRRASLHARTGSNSLIPELPGLPFWPLRLTLAGYADHELLDCGLHKAAGKVAAAAHLGL
jgi:hypothetical protein